MRALLPTLAAAALLSQTPLHAQIGVRGSRVVATLVADATYNTSTLPIAFLDTTSTDKSLYETYTNLQREYTQNTQYLDDMAGIVNDVYEYTGSDVLGDVYSSYIAPYAGYVIWAYQILRFYAEMEHLIVRNYDFYAPTAGTYVIIADLKGDWDWPNNKVRLVQNGAVQEFSCQLGSNQSRTYVVSLAKGPARVSVGLGSGTSFTFHTAGTLRSVTFQSPAPMQWTEARTIAFQSFDLVTALPQKDGPMVPLAVAYDPATCVPMNTPIPIPGGDGTVTFTNLRPAFGAGIQPVKIPAYKLDQIGRTCSPNLENVQAPAWDGTTATYFVRRLQDTCSTD